MLNQKLHQKLLQKLSPQQIQLIKLLELPTLQLEERIKKELEENPVLDEGKDEDEYGFDEKKDEEENDTNDDEFSVDDYLTDEDEIPSYKLSANNYSKDDKKLEVPYSEGMSLQEHLHNQLRLQSFSEKEELLAKYLIGNIDSSGYLRRTIEEIVDDIAFSQSIECSDDEMREILKTIQTFDPAGIAATNLQETLILQVERKVNKKEKFAKTTHTILSDFFDEFSKKHYSKITQKLGITQEELKGAINLILKLNPKPGSSFSGSYSKTSQHIIPDFILEIQDGIPYVSLNSRNIPDLKVNSTYAGMLNTYKNKQEKNTLEEKNAITFVKQKLDSAKWFIDAIKQRHNTLLLTMNSIIEYQKEYFINGDETKMKPMILKDIATETDLDISTISRVANSKYIQTHFGIFPLKYFFSEGMGTTDGGQVSTREIKRILQECINGENPQKPLTDEKLAKILQEKGYQIARRTVAKYREQLGILVARLRKKL